MAIQPSARSCHSSKTSTSGSRKYAGFWAPLCFSVKKGPSRKMPWMRAASMPFAAIPSAASATDSQASPVCSTLAVSVVGSQEVTPLESKPWAISMTPSGSQSIISWSRKPWIWVSTRPGATQEPVRSTISHSGFSLVKWPNTPSSTSKYPGPEVAPGKKNLSALTANVLIRTSIILKRTRHRHVLLSNSYSE